MYEVYYWCMHEASHVVMWVGDSGRLIGGHG